MANRLYRSEYVNSFQTNGPVFLEGRFTIGASGAVSGLQGAGIASVTKLTPAGTYLIKLEDSYNRLLEFNASFIAPVTGAAVNDGALVVGTLYRIVTVGTSNFVAAGARANTVGVTFVATTVGGAGSGTVQAVGNSAIVAVEVADASVDGAVSGTALASSFGIIIQMKTATATVGNATTGSVMLFSLMLRNSAVKGKGEL